MQQQEIVQKLEHLTIRIDRVNQMIKNSDKIELIDIDLSLNYLRTTYEALMEVREKVSKQNREEIKQPPLNTIDKRQPVEPKENTGNISEGFDLNPGIKGQNKKDEDKEPLSNNKTPELKKVSQSEIQKTQSFAENLKVAIASDSLKVTDVDSNRDISKQETVQIKEAPKPEISSEVFAKKEEIRKETSANETVQKSQEESVSKIHPKDNDALKKETIVKTAMPETSKKSSNDVRKYIGINDKIIFTQQLFDGNQEAYNETIGFINASEEYGKVEKYFAANVLHKFNWTEKKEIANRFIDAARSRFNLD